MDSALTIATVLGVGLLHNALDSQKPFKNAACSNIAETVTPGVRYIPSNTRINGRRSQVVDIEEVDNKSTIGPPRYLVKFVDGSEAQIYEGGLSDYLHGR